MSDSYEFDQGENREHEKKEIALGIAAHMVAKEIEVSEPTTPTSLLADIHREHPEIEERAYQLDCLDTLDAARKAGHKRALVQMATGLGKTTVVATDVKGYLKEKPDARVLFLCHQNQILRQARGRFEQILGGGEHTFGNFTGESKDIHAVTCLFASFQTMRDWKRNFRPDEFDYIVVDESHHAKAETYEPTLKYYRPKFMVGLTATPDRQDLKEIRDIFGREVYSKTLAQALADGLLAKPDYRVILDEVQQDILKGALGKENVSLTDLNRTLFIPRRDEEVARLISEKSELIPDPKTIIFSPSIEHTQRITGLLPDSASYHSGMSREKRQKTLDAFRNGSIRTLVSVDMFNEGVDIPDANVIVFLRSTQSEIIFLQQLGRGLRKLPEKDSVLVLDFVANCDRLLMIENLLRKTITSYQTSHDITDPKKADAGNEPVDEAVELDLTSIEAGDVEEEIRQIEELQLGSFEFTETTRKILELIRKIQIETLEPAPDGYVSNSLFAKYNNVSVLTVRKLLDRLGIDPPFYRFHNYNAQGLSPELQEQLLNEDELSDYPPDGYLSINVFAKQIGFKYTTVNAIIDELGLANLSRYKFGPTRAEGLSPEIQTLLRQHPLIAPRASAAPAPEGSSSIHQLVSELKKSRKTILGSLKSLGISTAPYKVGPKLADCISIEQREILEQYLRDQEIPAAPENVQSIAIFAKSNHLSPPRVEKILSELGIEAPLYRFGAMTTSGLTPEIGQQILDHLEQQAPRVPTGWISMDHMYNKTGIHTGRIARAINELGLEIPIYTYKNGKITGAISPENQRLIIEWSNTTKRDYKF